ncbi:hypothetical protein GCM10008957_32390 [Deinococcus ruber]|uniref:Uncharacterized protein n=1 Tax=Deinococcus ruber TaxID=1848197 RepID=A0A918CDW3_9DEIO|nr:hypothetical protein GCM10008957_32390 [Deinococcus ruber]
MTTSRSGQWLVGKGSMPVRSMVSGRLGASRLEVEGSICRWYTGNEPEKESVGNMKREAGQCPAPRRDAASRQQWKCDRVKWDDDWAAGVLKLHQCAEGR